MDSEPVPEMPDSSASETDHIAIGVVESSAMFDDYE
jgi:hypothetical protein